MLSEEPDSYACPLTFHLGSSIKKRKRISLWVTVLEIHFLGVTLTETFARLSQPCMENCEFDKSVLEAQILLKVSHLGKKGSLALFLL